jgi:metal transporter CNNM
MGQDEIYLQVIQQSGDHNEKKNATKVLRLLKRGKHWVLVTLLLSNVITNETLPIVLDRSLGGGWPAVLSSTILIGMRTNSESIQTLGFFQDTNCKHSYFW